MKDVKTRKKAVATLPKARKTRRVPAADAPPRSLLAERPDPRLIAEWVRRAFRLPAVREDLVKRVKAELADGTYETREKLDIAIRRLLEDLREG